MSRFIRWISLVFALCYSVATAFPIAVSATTTVDLIPVASLIDNQPFYGVARYLQVRSRVYAIRDSVSGTCAKRVKTIKCGSQAAALQPTVVFLTLRRRVMLGHLRPIHHVPPRINIGGPLVLILQIVGMLPDIDAEDGCLALHQRIVLVRRAHNA